MNLQLKKIKDLLGEKFSALEKIVKDVFMEVVAKDGTVLKYEGDLKEGVALFISTPDGDIAAPDGVVELEDGTMLEIEAGLIKAITKVAEEKKTEEAPEKMNEVVASLTAQLEALTKRLDDIESKFKSNDITEQVANAVAQLSTQKAKIEEVNKSVVDMAEIVKAIAELPIAEPKEKEKFSSKKDEKETRVKALVETLNKLKQ